MLQLVCLFFWFFLIVTCHCHCYLLYLLSVLNTNGNFPGVFIVVVVINQFLFNNLKMNRQDEKLCLKWNDFQENAISAFGTLHTMDVRVTKVS